MIIFTVMFIFWRALALDAWFIPFNDKSFTSVDLRFLRYPGTAGGGGNDEGIPIIEGDCDCMGTGSTGNDGGGGPTIVTPLLIFLGLCVVCVCYYLSF